MKNKISQIEAENAKAEETVKALINRKSSLEKEVTATQTSVMNMSKNVQVKIDTVNKLKAQCEAYQQKVAELEQQKNAQL